MAVQSCQQDVQTWMSQSTRTSQSRRMSISCRHFKFSLPNEFTPLCLLFHCLPRPPHSLPRPPILCPALYVRKASCSSMNLGQLKRTGSNGGRYTFCLRLLSLSCHGECNRWQIITEAGSNGLAEVQFISRYRFKFLTRWQHAGSTVRRHVSHGVWFPGTD